MLLAQEDYVDYYHNIVTFKVNSDAKLRPLNLSSPLTIQQDIEVVALARDFYTCKLSESCGLLRGDYPYFGCEQLLSSTCRVGQVSFMNQVFKLLHICLKFVIDSDLAR
jgi:hypothetical protein